MRLFSNSKSIIKIIMPAIIMFAVSFANNGPQDLEAWRSWVLKDHPDILCPSSHTSHNDKICAWPSELNISISTKGAKFSQQWMVYGETWLALPGESMYWPQAVSANGKPVPVAQKSDIPHILLQTGTYAIRGKFVWNEIPASLQLPRSTALVNVSVNNQAVINPEIDKAGKLWIGLQTPSEDEPARQNNEQDIKVYRKLVDGIPMRLITQAVMTISGTDRELLTGRLLPSNFTALRINSPLPARVEKDGRLRIQVRSGRWTIEVESRQLNESNTYAIQSLDSLWPQTEIWSFEADRRLRTVNIKGVPSIDPQQTGLPDSWKSLPAYLLKQNSRLIIEEQHRGDHTPAPNQLRLKRDIWLDFNGKGFTLRDKLQGSISQRGRISMHAGYKLGRVEVNGSPRLITALADGQPGIEVQQGNIQLIGVSRFEKGRNSMHAGGWMHNLESLSASLKLPPGYRLFHAFGPDSVDNSWISQWNLWDIFIVLIIAITAGKIIGWRWGLMTGLLLALVFHEPEAPVFLWLAAIVLIALNRVLPPSRFLAFVVFVRNLTLLALLGMLVLFSITQIRKGIYLQLERKGRIISAYNYDKSSSINDVLKETGKSGFYDMEESIAAKSKKARPEPLAKKRRAARPSGKTIMQSTRQTQSALAQTDASAQIQTGPGQPRWRWNKAGLYWNGPVEERQTLNLLLIPPWMSRILYFVQVLLALIFFIKLITFENIHKTSLDTLIKGGKIRHIAIILLGLTGLLGAKNGHAQFPDMSLLKQLEERLLKAPECLPHCGSMSKGHIAIKDEQIKIELVFDVLSRVYMPLPANRQNWMPRTVLVNGSKAKALAKNKNGNLITVLDKGRNRVVLEGAAPSKTFNLNFEIKANNITATADAWRIGGLEKNRIPSGTLQFSPIKKEIREHDKAPGKTLLPDPISPFVTVKRRIVLENQWRVYTTVQRVAPSGGAISLDIEPLGNASVITAGILSEKGLVKVNMNQKQNVFRWESLIDMKDSITLTAAVQTQWAEIWTLEASTKWHTRVEGLPPIKQDMRHHSPFPTWRPLPGEQISIHVSKPGAIKGPTCTIENVRLKYHPGARTGKAILFLSVRSSQGGQTQILLPPNITLESFKIDDMKQVISQKDNKLQLPLRPGVQSFEIKWKEKRGLSFKTRTPQVQVNQNAANIELEFTIPSSRWALFVGGPTMGPAMLYWGVFIVLMILSMFLSKLRVGPLKTWHWILLLPGLSTVNSVGGFFIMLWFFALGKRRTIDVSIGRNRFNLFQIVLIALTLLAMGTIVSAVPMGLLSNPNMQITGNGSTSHWLCWYQDFCHNHLPSGWVISLPMWAYRAVMLAWSFWLALMLIKWTPWAWNCFSSGGLWLKKPKLVTKEKAITIKAKPDKK